MQCIKQEAKSMSFGFNNVNQFKAQAAYKDGGGMGGGGMYMRQGKKRKDQPDDDIFQSSEEKKDEEEILFGSEPKEKDIPQDTLFNKFMNWFRPQD